MNFDRAVAMRTNNSLDMGFLECIFDNNNNNNTIKYDNKNNNLWSIALENKLAWHHCITDSTEMREARAHSAHPIRVYIVGLHSIK